MNSRGTWVIIVSLFIAVVLTILPLPNWAVWARPLWVLIILIYWVLALDCRVGVGVAWVMGILLDILGGTLLGEHALAMAIVIYIVAKLQRQIRIAPLMQQTLLIFILSAIYLGIIYVCLGLTNRLPSSLLYWLPVFITALLWPWLFILLRDCRRRFKVT
ncbi:MAG: rod shape-determining protein MreD [Gammaproteobacteria bacterium]|nr:rod shape-determining protein MreD [Gammaproteobacteria bacterium]